MTSLSCRAVQPRDTLERLVPRTCAEHLIAQLRCWSARVIEFTINAGHDLHARSAQVPLLHISLEGARQIIGSRVGLFSQADRVLSRHAGTLREVLQHRMRG